jgi:purine-binding chemotaxis protein CheW
VLELASGDIKPAPEFSALLDAGYITGLGTLKAGDDKGEARMLILVDIEKLMGSADMALVDRATA